MTAVPRNLATVCPIAPFLAVLTLALTVPSLAPTPASAQQDDDARLVREVVESAYVRGVWIDRDPAAVRAGFHPDFVMSVNSDDALARVTLDEWLGRMGLDGTPAEHEVAHVFEHVDVTGGTAVVRLRLSIDGVHRYTDYLSLYRLADGWRIVGKVFEPAAVSRP